jgi:hypothetical protein
VFQFPFVVRVAGFFVVSNNVQSDYTVVLANTAGTALATFTGDKDKSSYYAAGTNYGGTLKGYFASPVDLAVNTKYYLTLVPQSATNVDLAEATILNTAVAAQMGMWNGGTAANLVTRDSGGAYTETTTQRPYGMGIIVSAFDDAVSGGGRRVGDGGGRTTPMTYGDFDASAVVYGKFTTFKPTTGAPFT